MNRGESPHSPSSPPSQVMAIEPVILGYVNAQHYFCSIVKIIWKLGDEVE